MLDPKILAEKKYGEVEGLMAAGAKGWIPLGEDPMAGVADLAKLLDKEVKGTPCMFYEDEPKEEIGTPISIKLTTSKRSE